MANNPFFFVSPFNFDEIRGSGYGPSSTISDSQIDELQVLIKPKMNHFCGMDKLGADDDDRYGCFNQHSNKVEKGVLVADLSEDQHEQQQEPKSNYSIFDDLDTSFTVFPPTQTINESTTDHQHAYRDIKQMPASTTQTSPFASLEILSNYENGLKKLNNPGKNAILSNAEGGKNSDTSYPMRRQKLSTEEIIRIAGSMYIQFYNSQETNDVVQYHDFYTPMHPFGYALSGLSQGETRDVELVHLLLAAAEKVGYQQYDRATRLLRSCQHLASSRANPVERVVFLFAESLREKIDKENGNSTRRISTSNCTTDTIVRKRNNTEIAYGLSTNIISVTCHQQLPFLHVLQFPAIQAIVESFESETKLHVIDLEIRSGTQWTGLMQELAGRNDQDRPLELLKITAVGKTQNEVKMKETQNRLMNLAEFLNIPFSFKPVILSDMEDINEALFETEEDEALAVYSSLLLRMMISRPRCLEKLMRVITSLKPSIMVVIEVEANLNSPSFANRFIEALFFYGAFFDCFETCIKQEEFKTTMEEILSMGIRNIVATENGERVNRSVSVGVWRAFFERYRMVEMKLSDSSLYQASLVAKRFGCGSSLGVERSGKCLMVGWKGTPIHSLSAWKFL
ncbi:GRAS transcription factor [Trema orientale]|uniref:GRAS transcription factor n=1 Tax=Trema orientale TaxID=63057 RepID=A0A2P5DGI4_TREOI|nr:GRAS transcription factor [Trema orientale]